MSTFRTLIICISACFLIGCFPGNGDADRLKAENDSLRVAKQQIEDEVNAYLTAFNTIQENIERIKQMENTISIEPVSETMNNDQVAKVNEDIKYLNDMLQSNRKELSKLRDKLKGSSLKISQLEKSLQVLTEKLEAEGEKIGSLEKQLAQKNELITLMSDTISSQNDIIDDLTRQTEQQQQVIDDREHTIASAWYVFGSKKELREQGIMSSAGFSKKVLEEDFNKDYFVKIDARKTTNIPIYASRAKILTNHPKSSYSLNKDSDHFTLSITDSQAFWSVSRYLVIETD